MADGTLVIVQRTGKIEKKTPSAHKDSIICVKWSYDGSSLASSGEDGLLKIWSKNGSFRNNLVQGDKSIYSICWSPQNDSILYCCQKSITLKPIQPSKKSSTWKAHEGIVLKLDWNPSSNLIVSTGEDCRYKIWDSYGRQLFCSAPYDYVLTSAAWAPCGNYLAVGGYGMVRLCDKTGWTYSYHKLGVGSPLKLCWSADSTQLAGACGSGDIIYGAVLDRSYFFQSWQCRIVQEQKLIVKDLLNEAQEDITFKDRIVNLSIGYNQLVVTTSRQCYIYSFSNWNTPHILDLKDAVSLILLSPKSFCLLNITNGPTIYNYDGKLISNIKVAGKFPIKQEDRPLQRHSGGGGYQPQDHPLFRGPDRQAVQLLHLALKLNSGN